MRKMKNRKPSFCDKTSFSLAVAGVSRAVVLKETESTNDVAKEMLKTVAATLQRSLPKDRRRAKGAAENLFIRPTKRGRTSASLCMRLTTKTIHHDNCRACDRPHR